VKRRNFLKRLAGLTGLTVLAECSARYGQSGQIRRRLVLIQGVPPAGFQYYAGEQLWAPLREGDPLSLQRAANNPYDTRVVEVHWKGHMLGHTPRRENTALWKSSRTSAHNGLGAIATSGEA